MTKDSRPPDNLATAVFQIEAQATRNPQKQVRCVLDDPATPSPVTENIGPADKRRCIAPSSGTGLHGSYRRSRQRRASSAGRLTDRGHVKRAGRRRRLLTAAGLEDDDYIVAPCHGDGANHLLEVGACSRYRQLTGAGLHSHRWPAR